MEYFIDAKCLVGFEKKNCSNFSYLLTKTGVYLKNEIMKRLIKFLLLIVIGFLLFSCEREETLSNIRLCDSEHFYYAAPDSKIYLRQSLSEIWIVFEQDEVTKELAELILNKYSFIDMNVIASNYNQISVRINENVTNCIAVNDYLKVLNEDDEIFSATPVFYFSENDPDSYYILLSEVLAKNNENYISESDFIDYAKTINLELIEAKYSTQHFKVKEIKTGFEALEISNQIYESGKVQYAHPNFIVKIERH